MRKTKEEISKMTNEKRNGKKTADSLVMDELLEMGLSYGQIGTHYLHDSIVYSISMDMKNFSGVLYFCKAIKDRVCRKHNENGYRYNVYIERAIESAFRTGNIDYIMETFKNSCSSDEMVVSKNTFIMTVRQKIMRVLQERESYNATQLRIIIQGEVEKITDISALEGICKIVLALRGTIGYMGME